MQGQNGSGYLSLADLNLVGTFNNTVAAINRPDLAGKRARIDRGKDQGAFGIHVIVQPLAEATDEVIGNPLGVNLERIQLPAEDIELVTARVAPPTLRVITA